MLRATKIHAVLLAFFLLLGACAPAVVEPTPTATIPAVTAEPSAGPATRVVKHGMGESSIPASPQRVVVLDTGALADSLALGVRPVGAVLYGATDLTAYLGTAINGIEDVSTVDAPSIEAILLIKPDLIIGTKVQHEELYDELSRAAPTVLADINPNGGWKDYLLFVGDMLGKAGEAQAMLAAYEQRTSDFRETLSARPAPLAVSVVRSRPEGVDIYLPSSFAGKVVAEAGLQHPATQQDTDEFSVNISSELIPQLEADAIFWVQRNEKEAPGMAEFQGSPLWAQLAAVKEERVYQVDWSVWVAGWNITGANLLLDDLQKIILEK
jgi:iron complex transport system substrate-binding protein